MEFMSMFVVVVLNCVAAALPALLGGVIVAGAVRAWVGPTALRSALDGRSGPAKAFVLGFLLPLDALSMLPLAAEGRRAGVRTASLVAFLLAGGVSPFTMAAGLHSMEGWQVGVLVAGYVVCAALVVRVAGWVKPATLEGEAGLLPSGVRGLAAGVTQAAGGSWWLDVTVAVVATGLLAMALPAGFWAHELMEQQWFNFLYMGLAAPVFVTTAAAGMQQAAGLIDQDVSPGLALVWLFLGGGLTLGTVTFLARRVSVTCGVVVLVVAVVGAVAMGTVGDRVLRGGYPLAEDSHAFDTFSRPQRLGLKDEALGDAFGSHVRRAVTWPVGASAGVLVLLGVVGAVWRPSRVEGQAAGVVEGVPAGMSVGMSAGTAKAVRAGLLIAGGAVLIYIYFPAPEQLGKEMSGAYAELRPLLTQLENGEAAEARTKISTEAARHRAVVLLERLRRWAGKAPFSSQLRGGPDVGQQADGLKVTVERVSETVLLDGPQLETDNNLMMLQVRQLQRVLAGGSAVKPTE
jgi:hypothetical protein